MQKGLLYFGLLAISFVVGCRKEPLPVAEPAIPVFYLACELNDSPFRLDAGNNSYHMLPDFFPDSSGLWVMKAELARKNCSSCSAVTVFINDYTESSQNATFRIDSALRPGHYLFSDKLVMPDHYKLQLRPELDRDPSGNYTWTVSSEGKDDQYFNGYDVTFQVDARRTYWLKLRYEDATGCLTTHKTIFRLGDGPQPQVQGSRLSNVAISYKFSAVTPAGEEVSYLWQFGDGSVSAEPTPVHTFEPKASGYYTTTLTLTDGAGRKNDAFYQVPGTVDPICVANIRTGVTAIPNVKPYSKITVELRDANGKLFSSRGVDQPETSDFEIISVEDYQKNSKGLNTRKFRAKFNCVLKSGSEELLLKNGEAALAVAYK